MISSRTSLPPEEIPAEGPKSREAVFRVDVMFDDVEGEVVEAAETPDGDREKYRMAQSMILHQQEDGGKQAKNEEQHPFEFDDIWIGEITGGGTCRRCT